MSCYVAFNIKKNLMHSFILSFLGTIAITQNYKDAKTIYCTNPFSRNVL